MKRVDTKHDIGGKTKHAERVLSEDKYDIIQIHMKKGEVITSHHAKEETLIIVRTGKVYFIVEKETMTLTNEQKIGRASCREREKTKEVEGTGKRKNKEQNE